MVEAIKTTQKISEGEKHRYVNLDLLRGLCAVFVVFEHFCEEDIHNAFGISLVTSIPAHLILRIIYGIARTAVPVFFLLSGYLSINSYRQRIGKVINLFFMCLMYTGIPYIAINCIVAMRGNAEFNLINLFPRNYYLYLFSAVYALSPFINSIVKTISKKNFLRLIIILFVLFSLWSTITNVLSIVIGAEEMRSWYFTSLNGTSMGFNIANFMSLYLIGGYIRLYYIPSKKDVLPAILVIIISTTITSITKFFSINFSKVFLYYDSIFVVLPAIAMIIIFLNIQMRQNKFISLMGKHTFGTFLLHGNVSLCVEKIVTVDSVVSKGFGGTFLGILIFVFGVYALALLLTSVLEFSVRPINDRWKKTRLYNLRFMI